MCVCVDRDRFRKKQFFVVLAVNRVLILFALSRRLVKNTRRIIDSRRALFSARRRNLTQHKF